MAGRSPDSQRGERRQASAKEDRSASRQRRVIVTLLAATFVVILNETITGVALRRLMVDPQLGAHTVRWRLLPAVSTRAAFAAALGLFQHRAPR